MLLELHSHTSDHSKCSKCDPVELVRRIKEKKLQGLVITDHHYLWTEEEIRSLRVAAGAERSFLIFAAQEVETDFGHIIVYGAKDTIKNYLTLQALRKNVPEAALVLAHPFRDGKVPDKEKLINPLLDAIEIFSSNHTLEENCLGLKFWHEFKFNAIGGSDCHDINTAASFPTQFVHPVKTIKDLAAEIKAGRCMPFVKEIIKAGSNIVVNEVVIGTKGEDEARSRIIIKKISDKKKFDSEQKICQVVENMRRKHFQDKTFRIPRLISIDSVEQEIIEEGQRGRTLSELLPRVDVNIGRKYIALAARWLARLHKIKPENGDFASTIIREKKRFLTYSRHFQLVPQLNDKYFRGLVDYVKKKEEEIFAKHREDFVYNHGDYHPKNIIIGQDHAQDFSTVFVSVIDFDSTILMPAAFDVGYFLAQFSSQMEELNKKYPQKYFLDAYIKEAGGTTEDFLSNVDFFKIRANLSIASFLVKVGLGDGEQMKSIVSDYSKIKKKFR